MSGPPVRPRSRELEIVRVLFDKHLLERAVNLAEARWDGSGEMVRLAYHWRDLGPAERRQQLEAIGPEQLAKFRTLADLDPELAQVLDTLEARGVIPAATGIADESPNTRNNDASPAYDAVQPVAEQAPKSESPPDTGAGQVPEPEVTIEVGSNADGNDGGSGWSPDLGEDTLATLTQNIADVDLSNIDLEGYAQAEQQRRAEAVQSGEELLQRVRDRLNSSARRVTSNPIGSGSGASTLPAHVPARMPGQRSASAVSVAGEETRFTPPPDYWLNRLNQETVVVADANTIPPTDDQLVALANELGIELAEFVIYAGSGRALFGGLKRTGIKVDVVVGPIPSALAYPTLVVIRGRLFPRIEERLRAGMCDIPGTKATVRLDPRSRVLVLPRDS